MMDQFMWNDINKFQNMNGELLKYLQQDGIGKVMAKGLADVYLNKPNAPVKYLAAWLKQFSANQKEAARLESEQKERASRLVTFNAHAEEAAREAEAKAKKKEEHTCKINNFKEMVKCHQYQEELLA